MFYSSPFQCPIDSTNEAHTQPCCHVAGCLLPHCSLDSKDSCNDRQQLGQTRCVLYSPSSRAELSEDQSLWTRPRCATALGLGLSSICCGSSLGRVQPTASKLQCWVMPVRSVMPTQKICLAGRDGTMLIGGCATDDVLAEPPMGSAALAAAPMLIATAVQSRTSLSLALPLLWATNP